MLNGFRIGRIFGIAIHVDWSLAIIFLLVTFSLGAGVFPAWHPDWGGVLVWATAFAAALLFFVSVLLHELSHALVGRRHGVEVKRITLFIFGGLAHMEKEPGGWRGELWMAAVGPLTSLTLGALFILIAGWLVPADLERAAESPQALLGQLGPVATLFAWLGPINILLGLFNLVPGYPLDGGRVLRAALWAVTGDLRRATRLAAYGGRAFAFLLIALGFLMVLGVRVPIFGSGIVGGLWLAFIGWFLNNAALMSYRQLVLKESLEDVPVHRIMQTDPDTAKPEDTVQELVERLFDGQDRRVFPVADPDGRFMGLVGLSEIRRIARGDWPRTPAEKAMTPAERLRTVAPDSDAFEAMSAMARHNLNQLPVVENQRLRGLVRREDIFRWLALYGEAEIAGGRFGPLGS